MKKGTIVGLMMVCMLALGGMPEVQLIRWLYIFLEQGNSTVSE